MACFIIDSSPIFFFLPFLRHVGFFLITYIQFLYSWLCICLFVCLIFHCSSVSYVLIMYNIATYCFIYFGIFNKMFFLIQHVVHIIFQIGKKSEQSRLCWKKSRWVVKTEILSMSLNFNVLKNLQNMFVPLYNNCQPYVNIKNRYSEL